MLQMLAEGDTECDAICDGDAVDKSVNSNQKVIIVLRSAAGFL
jgi:hypothetical protein